MKARTKAAIPVILSAFLWGCSCNCNKPAATQPTASVASPANVGTQFDANYLPYRISHVPDDLEKHPQWP
jgi:hypothetical protein